MTTLKFAGCLFKVLLRSRGAIFVIFGGFRRYRMSGVTE
jgi:hypothetical protein